MKKEWQLLEWIRFTQMDDGGVCLDTRSGDMFAVDGVGARICALLRDGAAAEDISAAMLVSYPGQSATRLTADVDEFLTHLEQNHIASCGTSDKGNEDCKI